MHLEQYKYTQSLSKQTFIHKEYNHACVQSVLTFYKTIFYKKRKECISYTLLMNYRLQFESNFIQKKFSARKK